MLREWFDVAPQVTLDLPEVDSAVAELGDPVLIAALAMRKLQALHLLATPGVRTTTDVVVAIVNDLERALIQAPVMRLKVQAAVTDWDRDLMDLEAGATSGGAEGPAATDEIGSRGGTLPVLHALPARSDVRRDRGFRRRDPLPRMSELAGGRLTDHGDEPARRWLDGPARRPSAADVIADALRRGWGGDHRPARRAARHGPHPRRAVDAISTATPFGDEDFAGPAPAAPEVCRPFAQLSRSRRASDWCSPPSIGPRRPHDRLSTAPDSGDRPRAGQGGQLVHRDQWAFDFFPFPQGSRSSATRCGP